jgi:hypothetical protein
VEQLTVLGANYGVAEGTAEQQEADGSTKPLPIRVPIFNDPQSTRSFQFPLPVEKAVDLAMKLLGISEGSDPRINQVREIVGLPPLAPESDLLVPDREPSSTELEKMARAAKGEVEDAFIRPNRPTGPVIQRSS